MDGTQLADAGQAQSNATLTNASGWLGSPWLWGGGLTWGFYLALPYVPVHRELLQRYFCNHPLEYALAALFFVGLAILVAKALRLSTERHALLQPLPELDEPAGPAEWSASLFSMLSEWPQNLRGTWCGTRLADLAQYLRSRRSTAGVEAHAKYLAESAADRHHDTFALLQTVTWAVPILGFLGTVMGITLAIANVTPEQLDTSLDSVTSGLAVAFDTTAVALSQSIVLVFGYFFVKRSEQQVLLAVDDMVLKGIVSRLAESSASPLLDAQSHAAKELLDRTEGLIQRQASLWEESVAGIRERWNATLDAQQQELAAALSEGVAGSLESHEKQLRGLRHEFLTAYEEITAEATRQLSRVQAAHEEQQQQLHTSLSEAWRSIQADLAEDRTARQEETAAWLGEFSGQMQTVGSQLAEATSVVRSQLEAVSQQTDMLARIVSQEENLAGLQQRLTENLEALQAAETMQETLHSLNAAIHLLTARARPMAA
jgi:hypothetical protein